MSYVQLNIGHDLGSEDSYTDETMRQERRERKKQRLTIWTYSYVALFYWSTPGALLNMHLSTIH